MKKQLLAIVLLTVSVLFRTKTVFAQSLNPINSQTIPDVLGAIMTGLKNVAGPLAIVFIVVGGIMYMLSGGSKEMMERGKKTILYALAGLAIVLAAPTFYSEIKSILGGGAGSAPGATSLQAIALGVLKLLLAVAGTLAIISMVLGAIWMFLSGGEKERLELGKKTVVYSIIGVAIVAGALIIAQQIGALVGG